MWHDWLGFMKGDSQLESNFRHFSPAATRCVTRMATWPFDTSRRLISNNLIDSHAVNISRSICYLCVAAIGSAGDLLLVGKNILILIGGTLGRLNNPVVKHAVDIHLGFASSAQRYWPWIFLVLSLGHVSSSFIGVEQTRSSFCCRVTAKVSHSYSRTACFFFLLPLNGDNRVSFTVSMVFFFLSEHKREGQSSCP